MADHVLIVEDHPDIAAPLMRTLTREGYEVSWVDMGQAALDRLASEEAGEVAAVILDLGLPDMDGLDVCSRAREAGYTGGILILSARGDELDRVVGLDYGADDYLAKPFSLAELQARVRALVRRTSAARPTQQETAPEGLHIDRAARRVTHADAEIALTAKEYDVLALLAEHPGAVVSREDLMAKVWDENWFGSTKTLDVTVGRLRQKLEDLDVAQRVITVRGVGFRLEGPGDA
ncbi:response regulator transcription factor [Nocardioides terrisoli]|uniref:response regulator transcription factor n=1 Tax=Nocardioides terrisoli TaxID=3388267 RepID=UPI00287BB696|nr:response regulator transcription factor [Nocardioides marmorisolisilvae]